MKDDKILYEEFLKGDISAFEELVIKYKDNLIYFISRYIAGDIYMAEDIAQDVFAHIYVYKEKYRLDYSFKTFIYTLGRNKAVDYVRKQARFSVVEFQEGEESLASQEESLEDRIVRDEEGKSLIKNIRALNTDYARAIYLADLEGLSYKEIGRVLGKTLGQTKVLIYRARQRLKELVMRGAEEDER